MEHDQITPQAGWLQHNPVQIADNAITCVKKAIQELRAKSPDAVVSAMGVTNQRETTVAWCTESKKPLCDAIVWSDARTDQVVADVSKGDTNFARAICGLPCSTYFSATKMKWMLDNVPAVAAARAKGTLRFGTIDSWLVYVLSGHRVHITDCTNASRTMLMNIATLQWSADMCARFDIPMSTLPRIVSSSEFVANTAEGVTPGHPPIPITGVIGDQQGALVGQLCFRAGLAKNTYGTGCFLLANVGTRLPPPSESGLLTTVGFKLGNNPCHYALEGAIAGAGSTVQWLRDRLGIIAAAADSADLAASVPDSGGVIFVPAFGGLLAPYWDPHARGTILGITQQTTKAHIARAVLDAVAQQVTQLVRAMEHETHVTITTLSVDGGMVANETLMQIQADSLGKTISVPIMLETTALGAAICASLVGGHWGRWEDLKPSAGQRFVQPKEDAAARARRQEMWDAAVKRSVGWAKL